jgi:hypothetical protein
MPFMRDTEYSFVRRQQLAMREQIQSHICKTSSACMLMSQKITVLKVGTG